MNNPDQPIDIIAIGIITLFFLLLAYAGFLANKSIDYDILKKLEAQPLVLPSPATSSAQVNPGAVVSPTPSKAEVKTP